MTFIDVRASLEKKIWVEIPAPGAQSKVGGRVWMTVIARENILSVGRRVAGCTGRVGNGEAFEINGIRVAGRSPESIVSPSPRRPAEAVLGRVGKERG